MSVISLYLAPAKPSLVFFDNGSWLNFTEPTYREKEPSCSRPIGALWVNGSDQRGLKPESGLPESIHDSRKSISSTSAWRFWNLNFFDLGLLILVRFLEFLGLQVLKFPTEWRTKERRGFGFWGLSMGKPFLPISK